jgi:hypothetical protein
VFETAEQRHALDQRIITQAMESPVLILDAGNCFNPLRLARSIRRQTLHVRAVLDRIQVARAFTCFQVISLLEATIKPGGPVYILRLMTTYTDEMVPVYERLRLLEEVEKHLERLRRAVPLVVTIRGARLQDVLLLEWLSRLQASADEVRSPDREASPEPVKLF